MPQPRSGLRAELHRTRDHARAVGDIRLELDVEITIILYLGEDPDTRRKLTPPDAWRLAADRIRLILALDDGESPALRVADPRQSIPEDYGPRAPAPTALVSPPLRLQPLRRHRSDLHPNHVWTRPGLRSCRLVPIRPAPLRRVVSSP